MATLALPKLFNIKIIQLHTIQNVLHKDCMLHFVLYTQFLLACRNTKFKIAKAYKC